MLQPAKYGLLIMYLSVLVLQHQLSAILVISLHENGTGIFNAKHD